jgi:molybdenum cofactor biosynthesis enzyme MoaA
VKDMEEPATTNSCAGFYGKCLDVKLTDECNGSCAFCIEKSGRRSSKSLPMPVLAKIANDQHCDNILILGGEPLMVPNIQEFLKNVKGDKYITTNGSLLTEEIADQIGTFLQGINISIHSDVVRENQQITGLQLNLKQLKKSIQTLHQFAVKVRINCNLIHGYIESSGRVDRMINFAYALGADEIRFTELQQYPALFVDAKNIWRNLHSDPFHEGCEEIIMTTPIKVMVRTTCGFVNPLKPKPSYCGKSHGHTLVLYPDGIVSQGWVQELPKTQPQITVTDNIMQCHQRRSVSSSDSMQCH